MSEQEQEPMATGDREPDEETSAEAPFHPTPEHTAEGAPMAPDHPATDQTIPESYQDAPEDRSALRAGHDPAFRSELQALDIAGVYHYDGDQPTDHPVLGLITPGATEYTNDLHPEGKAAIQDLVKAGVLRKG